MPDVVIRKCQKRDQIGIQNVCYRTGYMGESLTGKNVFNDQKLFGYLFCLYYPRYEAEHGFIAIDPSIRKISGYVIGSTDSLRQEKQFRRKMVWPIFLRLLFLTRWKYPESFQAVMSFRKTEKQGDELKNLYEDYPAHLHINVLPEYQRRGLGSKLMRAFEEHIQSLGVPGIHLVTSNYNVKAIPFYKNQGYQIICKTEGSFWSDVENYEIIIFAKKL